MSYIIENENSKVRYSSDEICPMCGAYTVDGGVCSKCLADHEVQKPVIDSRKALNETDF